MLNYGYSECAAFQSNFSGLPGTSDGIVIVPGGSNSMSGWVDLMGGVLADDSYGIWLNVQNGTHGSGTTGATLMDIGIDYAGGSSYSVLIPYLGFSGEVETGGSSIRGALFYFPLYMPKGARLAARAQSKASSPLSSQIIAKVGQKPSRPNLVRYGTYVDAIGVDPTNSRGTVFVPGNGAWGSWTSLGTSLRDAWWWNAAFVNDLTSATNNPFMVDVAVGNTTAKLTLGPQLHCAHTSSISVVTGPEPDEMNFADLPAGTTFYVRGNEHFGVDSNYTAILYALGGG